MQTAAPPTRLRDVPAPIVIGSLAWLAIALVLAATGVFQHALPLVPLTTLTAVAGSLIAWRRSAALRAWTAGLDLRVPILLHVARIGFGVLFLFELAAGRLPAVFAERGGYGDIIAGALAIVAAVAAGSRHGARRQADSRRRRAIIWVFSIFGLLDILVVFATAQVEGLVHQNPLILGAIGRLPYSLLPSVVVPLVIVSHMLVMQRLRALGRGTLARVLAVDPGGAPR